MTIKDLRIFDKYSERISEALRDGFNIIGT